eukprot:TRINITY_DN1189_c0_g1_i2.p1 TRINITY_DN1189_c0_g1~~TRINITY_DN1189_c0_g1_i2.p1  ORF type:complete len:148 (+),score=15.93 TRINITY_DN1189_c0_g1_i2:149-592(+)
MATQISQHNMSARIEGLGTAPEDFEAGHTYKVPNFVDNAVETVRPIRYFLLAGLVLLVFLAVHMYRTPSPDQIDDPNSIEARIAAIQNTPPLDHGYGGRTTPGLRSSDKVARAAHPRLPKTYHYMKDGSAMKDVDHDTGIYGPIPDK